MQANLSSLLFRDNLLDNLLLNHSLLRSLGLSSNSRSDLSNDLLLHRRSSRYLFVLHYISNGLGLSSDLLRYRFHRRSHSTRQARKLSPIFLRIGSLHALGIHRIIQVFQDVCPEIELRFPGRDDLLVGCVGERELGGFGVPEIPDLVGERLELVGDGD